MLNFYLPDFYSHFKLNKAIILLIKQHPEYFLDNLKIGAIYGSFPGAIWNGGRVFWGGTSQENIVATIEEFNNLGIPLRFTFTNNQLLPHHCEDTYCNLIMEKGNNNLNEVLVNSPILEEHIRSNYPKYKVIASTTKCERNLEQINKNIECYDLVVIDYNDNHNFNFLDKINNKEKIELLINAYCIPNCPNRKEHYTQLSKDQLDYLAWPRFQCENTVKGFYDILNYSTIIHQKEILNTYFPLGFKHFKIEGRTLHTIDVLESYIYYLVKDEYKEIVRYNILKTIWNNI